MGIVVIGAMIGAICWLVWDIRQGEIQASWRIYEYNQRKLEWKEQMCRDRERMKIRKREFYAQKALREADQKGGEGD